MFIKNIKLHSSFGQLHRHHISYPAPISLIQSLSVSHTNATCSQWATFSFVAVTGSLTTEISKLSISSATALVTHFQERKCIPRTLIYCIPVGYIKLKAVTIRLNIIVHLECRFC